MIGRQITSGCKKYVKIARVIFQAQLVYRFDVALSMLLTVTKILFAYILWGAVFSGKAEVAGFTFQAMLSYYIISSFLSQLDMSGGISEEVSERIRNGNFSKYMVIPVNVLGYFGAQTAGASAFYMSFNLIAAVLWTFVFRVELIITGDAALLFAGATMCLLGLIFMVQLNFLLGLFAFKWGNIGLFLMIKNTIVGFITGTLAPLVFLPSGIVAVMRYFPFYYVTYLPSMLLIGRKETEALPGLIILCAWIIVLIPINRFAYKKLRIKYDGVGI